MAFDRSADAAEHRAAARAATDSRVRLFHNLRIQAIGCAGGGSPFYHALFDRMASDVATGGITWTLLEPFASEDFETVRPLRLAGALHKLVVLGQHRRLEQVWEGAIDTAWPVIEALWSAERARFEAALARPVQTNEVGRSVALVGGLLQLAREHQLPVALHELGASGGLNLRPDCYWYQQGGRGWGDQRSAVRFVDAFADGCPPFDAPLEVVERGGCDLFPIDIADADGRATLLGFVWPGQRERFAALDAAITAARRVELALRAESARDHVDSLGSQVLSGRLLVIWHSIMWQYLSPLERAGLTAAIARVGAVASADAPVAWLRLEPPDGAMTPVALRATVWPGGHERLLAHGGFHRDPVRWMG